MEKKLLLILVLLFCCLGLVYSQDLESQKLSIISELENIEKQLITLEIKLKNSEKSIIDLQTVIQSLKQNLTNSENNSKQLLYELEKQKGLLQKSAKEYRELQEIYEKLSDQSEALYRRLKSLEKANTWLWVGIGVSGLAALVFGVALFAK